MKSLRSTKIGLAALTILFLLLYGYFSTLGKPLTTPTAPANQGFQDQKITLGNIGGFHLLKSINYSDETQFYRLIFETELNRSTASPEAIAIPYVVINEKSAGEDYNLTLNFSDTALADILQDKPLAIFPETAVANPLIKEIRAQESKDENSQITITLAKKTLFRATTDSTGTIVLDILK